MFFQQSNDNKYYKIFLSHNATRLACHNCLYTKLERESDITLGDYWGIEKFNSDINCHNGISKVIVNTKKGCDLFKNTEEKIEFTKMSSESAIRPNLQNPPSENPMRSNFFKDYNEKGFDYCAKKYAGVSLKIWTKKIIKSILVNAGLFEIIKNYKKNSNKG